MIIVLVAFGCALVLYKLISYKAKPIENKKILVLGGTSGLGKEVAKQLVCTGNYVTITSRNLASAKKAAKEIMNNIKLSKSSNNENRISNIRTINVQKVDIELQDDVAMLDTNYDYIFCIPGFCISKYVADHTMDEFNSQMNLNYLAIIRVILYAVKNSTTRPTILLCSSTVAYFHFPGYCSYAPTKAALSAFASCARLELEAVGIRLCVFNCPTMATPGLDNENKMKPLYTRNIEETNAVCSAECAVKYLIKNINTRSIITMDNFTYLVVIRHECEKLIDYILLPLAVIVVGIARTYANWMYKRSIHH